MEAHTTKNLAAALLLGAALPATAAEDDFFFGDLTRDHNIATLHAALRDDTFSVGGMKAYLELGLDPATAHSGGEINGSLASGLCGFATGDYSGYDTHSARLGLRATLSESTSLHANVIAGDDDSIGGNIKF